MATAKAKSKPAPAPATQAPPRPPAFTATAHSVRVAEDLLIDVRVLSRITGQPIGELITEAARPAIAEMKARLGREWLGR